MRGCHTERANIYFSDSVQYDEIAAVDIVLGQAAGALLTQLKIDVTARPLPSVHVVSHSGELDPINDLFDHPTESPIGWYSCCSDRPGIYTTLGGTWPLSTVAHEYVHFALDKNVYLPSWLNEGLATYYDIELAAVNPAGPFDPTGEVYWYAGGAQSAALEGALVPLTASERAWSQTPSLRYSQGYMVIRYIVDLHGYPAVARLLESIYQGSNVSTALSKAVNKSYTEFDSDFTEWLLAWGENDPEYQGNLEGSSGQLYCFDRCSRAEMSAGVSLADLSAEATFTNPTGTSTFEYGFNIRDFIYIVITNERTWKATAWSADWATEDVVAKGRLSGPVDTGAGVSNHLRVTALGNEGCLFANTKQVACFELPSHAVTGDVRISSRHGDVWFRGFAVEPLGE